MKELVVLSKLSPDVRTILDVGCGNGAFLNSLPDSYQAIGLILPEAQNTCKLKPSE